MANTVSYRPDIDGLRAVAVIPVVLFHANMSWFSGGYVGVDVFFVISGYLITSILLEDFRTGRYSILRFYERRIRRIFPALFVVIFCTSIVGCFLLLPDDLVALAKSTVAATLFTSNVFFWRESGYFDGPAEMKPLLHTWSLAVEEQYYIFFPIIIFFMYRFVSTRITAFFVVAGVAASFAFSVWGSEHMPVATFYLLPSRAWELLLGSVLAMGFIAAPTSGRTANICGLVGIILILGAIFLLDPTSRFPGVNALYPCVGAALIIHSGRNGMTTEVGRVLSWAPIKFVGLISYSLYLWHWPIIVFTKYVWIEELTPSLSVAVVAMSLIAAFFSWRFVEGPFRDRSSFSAKKIFLMGSAAMTAAVVVAVPAVMTMGLPARLPASVVTMADLNSYRDPGRGNCHGDFANRHAVSDLCVRGNPDTPVTFLLVGDSHAGAASSGIFEGARRAGVAGIQLTAAGYRPFPTLLSLDEPEKYIEMNRLLEDVLKDEKIRTIIVVAYWSQALTYRYANKENVPLDSATAVESGLVDLARSFPDRKFFLLTSPPVSKIFGGSAAARAQLFHRAIDISIPRREFEEMQSHYLGILRNLDREPNVDLIETADTLCDASRCYGRVGDQLAYRDNNHLSDAAARRLTPLIEQALRSQSRSPEIIKVVGGAPQGVGERR